MKKQVMLLCKCHNHEAYSRIEASTTMRLPLNHEKDVEVGCRPWNTIIINGKENVDAIHDKFQGDHEKS